MIQIHVNLDDSKYPPFVIEKLKREMTLGLSKYLGMKQQEGIAERMEKEAQTIADQYMDDRGFKLVAGYESLVGFLEKLSVRVR